MLYNPVEDLTIHLKINGTISCSIVMEVHLEKPIPLPGDENALFGLK